MTIEIILDSTHGFTNAQLQLQKLFEMAGKRDYKPRVMIIKSHEAWKTTKQNNTFHNLVSLYWRSGCCSYDSYEDLRNSYKYKVNLIDHYLYVDDNFEIQKVSDVSEIPEGLPRERKRVILGSFSNATKKQVQEAIDLLITDCFSSGVITSKVGKEFEAVINGLEGNKFENYNNKKEV